MVNSIIREMELKSSRVSEAIDTIYFGGGTPSLLSKDQLSSLFQQIHVHYEVSKDSEITLEANPEDLSPDKLNFLKSLGVNRLSIGVQTFSDRHLKSLNRIHDGATARSSIIRAQKAGFTNLSIDLIFAQPNLKFNTWQKDLITAIELKPQHISLYGLTIEENTVFGRWQTKGKIIPVSETENDRQYAFAHSELSEAGYVHYEVSNFCLPGYESRHNSSYWKQKVYLGFGPGAHSYDGSHRYFNVRNNVKYIKALAKNEIPEDSETLRVNQKLNEYILTRSRTTFGLALDEIKDQFDVDLERMKKSELSELIGYGLLEKKGNHLFTTFEGFKVADEIAVKLFFDP